MACIETSTFENFGLSDSIMRGIFSYGFETPSEIQTIAIPKILEGCDMVVQAQSGTGKTGAFTLGILELIDYKIPAAQALIITPTRELSAQVSSVAAELGIFAGAKVSLCVGGIDLRENRKTLQGAHILVGTLGRLQHLIEKRLVDISRLKNVTLDEADQLCEAGSCHALSEIIQRVPKDAQICLFSATMNDETIDIADQIMHGDPFKVAIKPEELTLDGIKQFYVKLESEASKLDTIIDLYSTITIGQSIIYFNSIKGAEAARQYLNENGFSVELIHGSLTPDERTDIVRRFRQSEIRVLLATDLFARGLDFQQISAIINYNMPVSFDTYLHRIGRGGRYGKKGISINLVIGSEMGTMNVVGKHFGVVIDELTTTFMEHLV